MAVVSQSCRYPLLQHIQRFPMKKDLARCKIKYHTGLSEHEDDFLKNRDTTCGSGGA